MKCGGWNEIKIWSSHLLDNLSNCFLNLKNAGDSTGFEHITSAMPVQCSNQLSCEVTQLRAGQFVGLMFSLERNVVWKKCHMKCGVWNQMKIWSSHLLDNLNNCLMNLKNSGDSTGFEPMTSATTKKARIHKSLQQMINGFKKRRIIEARERELQNRMDRVVEQDSW